MKSNDDGDTIPRLGLPVKTLNSPAVDRPVDDRPAPLEGRDRYDDIASLGEGGMGEVRLCLDRRIGREVAMKVIRGSANTVPAARSRFEREARVQGQLDHPAVVPVYDLGLLPDGTA